MSSTARDRRPSRDAADQWLATSELIGRRIAEQAFWYEDRCTWVGGDAIDPSRGHFAVSSSTLGPTLYTGTSGVAVYLAELHRATGEDEPRDMAVAAMRQTLARLDAVAPQDQLGLYTGWAGIAWAAARVGLLVGRDDFVRHAVRLAARVDLEAADAGFDLMAGRAGAILALLGLREWTGEPSLLSDAERLGDQLLETATEHHGGLAWSGAQTDHPPLTGYSHGAAGAAHALLALFAASAKERWADASRRAFAYERQWFDASSGNWADLRDEPLRRRPGRRPLPSLSYWCHGAPGIALSRLDGVRFLDDDALPTELETALDTTSTSLMEGLRTGGGNFSLCHGLAGNADVLLEARCRVPGGRDDDIALIEEVAGYGQASYGRARAAWPCGTHAAETPGLMLGLAGIGHFYLRLADNEVPSVLNLMPRSGPVNHATPKAQFAPPKRRAALAAPP